MMKHPIRRRLIYLSFLGLRVIVRRLPLGMARAIGRAVGWAAYQMLLAQRRLTLSHLQYALGDSCSPAQRARIGRRAFMNLGQNAMEWLVLPRLSAAQLQQLIASEGVEHLRGAMSNGEGAIVVTPHFGNWELIALYLKGLGFEGGVLARRLRYPEYESFLIGLRGERGVATLARGSLKEVAKLLRSNQIIGMLPDQDMDSLEGTFVNFFGHPAYTPLGPAALSLMTGAPILPCFMIRDGRRFRLVIEPALRAPQGMDRAQAMAHLTRAWSDVFESYIRRYPDHWVWMHRRWKTQQAKSAQGSGLKAEGHSPEPRARSPEPHRSTVPGVQLVLPLLVLSAYCFVLSLTGCAKSQQGSSSKPDASTGTEQANAPPPNSGEQMSQFELTGYEVSGAKRWELRGEGASVDNNVVTIHRPDAIGYDPGRTAYLTASVAAVNQANRHIRMEHEVTIHTTDGLWLTSPMLYWIPDQNHMATDQPVRIETDHMLLRGRGLDGFTQLKQATIARDIELVLNPSEHETAQEGVRQVTITCDGPLAFDYGNSVATFEQNVHVKDPNGDLFSDKLVAYLDQQTHTIRYAEAIGRVRILQNQNTALSERAVYEPSVGKITLVGKPSLLVYPSQHGQTPQLSFSGLVASQTVAAPKAPAAPQLTPETQTLPQ